MRCDECKEIIEVTDHNVQVIYRKAGSITTIEVFHEECFDKILGG